MTDPCQAQLRLPVHRRPVIGPLSLWISLAVLVAVPLVVRAADNANRTLFGNRAVQRDLRLTPEQRKQITTILDEMNDEITRTLKEAAGRRDKQVTETEIVDAALLKYGSRMQGLLDKQQALRLWQIGAQSSGPAVFSNNRVVRVLNLTPDQIQKLADESDKMIAEVTDLAIDVNQDVKTVEKKADAAKRACFRASLAILTTAQRKEFEELLGRPFNLELLKTDAPLPRPLTFVFGLSGQNWFALLTTPEFRKELALSRAQWKEMEQILRKTDDEVTAIRLSILKDAPADFPDMTSEQQVTVTRNILDGAAVIHKEASRKLLLIMTAEQIGKIESRLVRSIGARSIEFEPLAIRLALTDDQKKAFTMLVAEFEKESAILRVVVQQSDFDHQVYDRYVKKLEATTRAILTDSQGKTLLEIGK